MPWAYGYRRLKKAIYMKLLERRRMERAAAMLCTDKLEEEAVHGFGFKRPTYVIPNGFDVKRFAALPARGIWRTNLHISDEAR